MNQTCCVYYLPTCCYTSKAPTCQVGRPLAKNLKQKPCYLPRNGASSINGYNTARFKGPNSVPYLLLYLSAILTTTTTTTTILFVRCGTHIMKEPIIYDICRKWWAPSGRIQHLRVLFFCFFSKVVGRALRIASPERSPLFFLWRLCVQVSLSLPLTSLLSFQKQKISYK